MNKISFFFYKWSRCFRDIKKHGSVFSDFATVVQDGDVISPRLNVLETKYLKLEDQTWRMDARAGFWALVFEYMELEESQHCEHDYIQIKEITNR